MHEWSQRFGNTSYDSGYGVAVDASGNVIVTGHFNGTVDFGGGDLVSVGSSDIFVAKYDASGVHQWSKRFGGTGNDRGNGVAVDASGNVIVTGYFSSTVNFGGGNLVSAGGYDIFVAKYDASGVYQWSKNFGSTADGEQGYGVAVDASGNVIVTGLFNYTVDFGGGNLVSAGSSDIFLAKYGPSGVHQWSKRFGSTSYDDGNGVAVDASGNVIVTGFFVGTVDFGGGDLVSAGRYDIFVAKYGASGVHQWSKRFGGTGSEESYGVAVDASGNVLVTGRFQETVDFGGGDLVSAGYDDICLAKYDASGVHQWSQRFGGTSSDDGYGVAVDASGNVLVTGRFQNTADFGGGDLVSAGNWDIFVAKYNDHPACNVTPTSIDFGTVIMGDSLDLTFDIINAGGGTLNGSVGDTCSYFDVVAGAGAYALAAGESLHVMVRFKPGSDGTFDCWIETGIECGDVYCTGEGNDATGAGIAGANRFHLYQNHPNPFNPTTTIGFSLDRERTVVLAIYDVSGRLVRTLVNARLSAGTYAEDWDARDQNGRAVATGIYFCSLKAGDKVQTRKAVLLK